MKKEDTGFIVFKKEFSGSFQSLRSIVKFFLYNPGFAYLVARGIKLILEEMIKFMSAYSVQLLLLNLWDQEFFLGYIWKIPG